LDILLENSPAELNRLAGLVDDFARHHGLAQSVSNAVALALHEHVTNILSYGFDNAARHSIAIRLRLDQDAVRVEIEDDGRPFDPLARPPVDTALPLDRKPLGGLGIHMMRNLVDDLTYRRDHGRNVLAMRKRIA
jgi:anti-sigma regulatory factor (Ser/Thr protein kinase)